MYRLYFFIMVALLVSCVNKENEAALADIKAYHLELNKQYADRNESPLTEEDFQTFRSLDFYPPNLDYRIKASFELNGYPIPMEFSTTTDRKPIYQKYGTLFFNIDGKDCQLSVFESVDNGKEGTPTESFMFIPFTDLTNGDETYGGGRYMDFERPMSEEIILDFNKTYNPYCAYNHKYSCTIPPKENDLQVAIKAGVKKDLIKE